MNRGQALAAARRKLEDAGIEEAPLEGEVLLRHVLNVSRAGLFAGLEIDITAAQEKTIDGLLERRLSGEPAAYITGVREFYGLEFHVDPSVLIPRPESELLVEKAIRLARNNNIATMADIGTGSGAIAVSLAVNLPGAAVYATDISAAALECRPRQCPPARRRKANHLLAGSPARAAAGAGRHDRRQPAVCPPRRPCAER